MIKNLKKVISTLAAVAILATSASAFAVSFPDVDANASYAGAVEALTTLGVVNGDDNGKFNPENTVTRAEFAKMVVEALGAGSEAASSTDTKFVDAKGHWAAGYIEVGVAKAFINGYDEKTFGPDDQVTYAQAVKMLVAAIGYETYASQQGGWPSGYLAYGSELDIIAGVTGVANDTALTRAQCAVLIYNTLKAPICKVNGYEQNYKGEWVPKLEEMNGTAKGWQTLLTSKHDAYVVRGRVMDANKKEGTVGFKIEVAENFNGQYVVVPQTVTVNGTTNVSVPSGAVASYKEPAVNVGTTNAADMLYTYSEAIIEKDADTAEYTLVSITPYGAAKTVEFAAKAINDIVNPTSSADGVIKVKKENSSRTNDYKITSDVEVFVNGVSKGTGATGLAAAATELSAENKRGTVSLIDETREGSTSTDGKYDYVMVEWYNVDQVSYVKVKNDNVTIKGYATAIEWSLEDEDAANVVIYKDGAEISYEDVKEDDIILVKTDGANWYEIYVSDKTVSGTATGKSTTAGKEYLLVDGTKYELETTDDLLNSSKTPLNAEYVLFLDAMGIVYDFEISQASKNIGVVLQVYVKAGEDAPTVKLIDSTGEIVTYVAKTEKAAKDIVEAVTGTEGTSLDKPNKTNIADRVIEYTVSNGKIQLKDTDTAENVDPANSGAALSYKASTSKLNGYTIDATATTILDLDAYLSPAGGDIAVFDAANFEDEGDYKGWVYDRNDKTGVYGLVILTEGTTSLKAKSALAVVTASGAETEVDGQAVNVLTVARNGEEDIEVLSVNYAPEGAVVMYKVGPNGYVESGDLKVIFAPAASYNAMIDGVDDDEDTDDVDETYVGLLESTTTTFANAAYVANDYIVTSAHSESGYSIALDGANIAADDDDNKVEVYYGPVYSATSSVLELFKTQADGKSNVNTTEAFTLAGANVYTYDYDELANEGMRVSVGGTVQKSAVYKNMYATSDNEDIKWSLKTAAMVDPVVALVRVVDGDVTDVIYFVGTSEAE